MQTHTEISRQSPDLFSAEQLAKTIGADLDIVREWLDAGAIDRAIFGGGQFSKYELIRTALVYELVKLGMSPCCAKEIIREMEYDLQRIWEGTPSHFKAYALLIPTRRKWLVSWCWNKSSEQIDQLLTEGCVVLPVSDTVARITNEAKQVRRHCSKVDAIGTNRKHAA